MMAKKGQKRDHTVPILLLILLTLGVVAVVWHSFETPPSQEWVEQNLSGEQLAYHVWDEVPHVLFQLDDRVYFDHLKLDRISISLPPVPRWQMTGNWYYIDITDESASFSVARCTGALTESCPGHDTEVFGQINDREITALEMLFDGTWHRYPVAAPGYAIRLEGFQGTPSDYRWLDVAGRVVRSAEPMPLPQ